MRNDSCPAVTWCKDAKANDCDGCAVGDKILRLEEENQKLKGILINIRTIIDHTEGA